MDRPSLSPVFPLVSGDSQCDAQVPRRDCQVRGAEFRGQE